MTIDEIYDRLDAICETIREKSDRARCTAKKARPPGNMKKRDKFNSEFNSVARVYEMIYSEIAPLCGELVEHLSDERKKIIDNDIPF